MTLSEHPCLGKAWLGRGETAAVTLRSAAESALLVTGCSDVTWTSYFATSSHPLNALSASNILLLSLSGL